jgi:hypothetical protein
MCKQEMAQTLPAAQAEKGAGVACPARSLFQARFHRNRDSHPSTAGRILITADWPRIDQGWRKDSLLERASTVEPLTVTQE